MVICRRSVGRGMEQVIWFLTGNQGKLEEAAHHFAPLGYEIRPFPLPEGGLIEPQASDLKAIATSKLEQAKELAPSPTALLMVEDAGLFIDTLNGFPGVYSAYVNQTLGCHGVLRLLAHLNSEDPVQAKRLRSAAFEAVVAFWDGEAMVYGHGVCPGSIASEVKGEHGFGFDPIFVPADLDASGLALPTGELGALSTHGQTFGEVDLAVKHRFSHRRRALEDLVRQLPHRSFNP
jgi:XTP/dITP diphosphohydrolase